MIVTLGQKKKRASYVGWWTFFFSQEQLEVRDWMAGWLVGFVAVVVVIRMRMA